MCQQTSSQALMAKLAEGSTEVMRVVFQISQEGERIDPYNARSNAALDALENLGIRGSRLWNLYDALCDRNIGKLIAVLRAQQLGMIKGEEIVNAADNRALAKQLQLPWTGIDAADVLWRVRQRLPDFAAGY
jgi:hypothetical protein